MKGVIGYVLAGLGLLLLAISFMNVAIPGIDVINSKYILGVGLALVAAGIFVLFSSSKKTKSEGKKEVPIYEGSQVVGYRRE